jgi:N-acetylneuraminic acid mutarotase
MTTARGEVTVAEDGTLISFGFWRRLPDLPESKEQFGLEACAGRIYAVAGICEASETDTAFVYDIAARQWSPIAPLPREAQSVCLRTVNRRLFCFGGYDSRLALKYDDVWLYDPESDTWMARTPMPVPREDAGSAVIDGRVWIVGGLTNGGHVLVNRLRRRVRPVHLLPRRCRDDDTL